MEHRATGGTKARRPNTEKQAAVSATNKQQVTSQSKLKQEDQTQKNRQLFSATNKQQVTSQSKLLRRNQAAKHKTPTKPYSLHATCAQNYTPKQKKQADPETKKQEPETKKTL